MISEFEFIFINDGSNDGSRYFIETQIKHNDNFSKLKLASHNQNFGYGAAIQSGIYLAKYDWILTFDADGQHNHVSIIKIIEKLIESKSITLLIGTRSAKKFLNIKNIGRIILNYSEYIFLGSTLKDSNSGLKCFNKNIYLELDAIIPAPIDMSFSQHLAQTFYAVSKPAISEVIVKVDKRKKGNSKIRLKDFFIALRQNLTLAYSLKPKRFYYILAISILIIAIIYSLIILYLNNSGMPVAGGIAIAVGFSFVILGELRQAERENKLSRLKGNLRLKYFLNKF
jgi:glycosyltransferase involved in cell wall biosynthesis